MSTVAFGDFEWDADKAAKNARKHGVTFIEAIQCFLDPRGIDIADHTYPDRVVLIAASDPEGYRVLYVVYAERAAGAILRIISARRATAHEKAIYEDQP